MQAAIPILESALEGALDDAGAARLADARRTFAEGVDSIRFGSTLSQLSRTIKPREIVWQASTLDAAEALLADWRPERWNTLETARVLAILAAPDQGGADFERAVLDAFTYADEGELCALLKSLPLLPDAGRFVWRAGEGCRSNMRTVFESAACDSPYAAEQFDDVAWKQALLKSLFVGAPLWRIRGLDRRLSEDLARMALDYVDERRSAGRTVPTELWLCLGPFGGDRAAEALERELDAAAPVTRAAVGLALARGEHHERLASLVSSETDADVREFIETAAGECSQDRFRELDGARAFELVRN